MIRLYVFILIVLLAGCSKKDPVPEVAAKAPDTSDAAAANTVVLEESAQRSAGIRTSEAMERSMPETLRAPARLTNDEDHTWRVGAVTDGRVVQVLAAPGDFVREGQPLARLHSHDVHESRAQYRNAQTEMLRANATLQYAMKARDRARRLYDLKAGSLEQVEHAEAELRNGEATVTNARTEVHRTRQHLVEFLGVPEDGGHDRQPGGESDESDLVPVRSPAAGTVVTRNVTPGTVVTPASDLFVLSNLSSLWAIVEVNEEHLSKLRPGMQVRVYVQAWPREPFPGKIDKLGDSLDAATRTVKVRVRLPNPTRRLKPEMYATAEIEVGASRSAVFVPEEAIQEVRGQNVVFVLAAKNRFEVRPVEMGLTLEDAVEVVRGIRGGESVATHGAFILKSEYLKAALAGE